LSDFSLNKEKPIVAYKSKKILNFFLPIDEYEKFIFSKYDFYDVKGESVRRTREGRNI